MAGTFPSPMLAPNQSPDLEQIAFPTYASFKLDGIRLIFWGGKIYSRNGKEIHGCTANWLEPLAKEAHAKNVVLDGELYCPGMEFNKIVSASADGDRVKSLKFYCFDAVSADDWGKKVSTPFSDRIVRYKQYCMDSAVKHLIEPVEQVLFSSVENIDALLGDAKKAGTEGLILKHPNSLYKHGRATPKENTVWKVKFWATVNAVITGYKQQKTLTAEAKAITKRNAIGAIDRGHSKDNYELMDEIGSIELTINEGQVFPKGTITYAGFGKGVDNPITWENRHEFIGKHVELAYQETGVVDKPRFPKIVRFRDDLNS